MIRVTGIVLLILALMWLGYALFALAWDGGTSRATDDRIQIGFALVLAIGAAGMIARQSWGWMLCVALGVAVVAFVAFALFATSATKPKSSAGPPTLGSLPLAAQPLAAALNRTWWESSIDTLRQRERDNDAIARDWALQGDAQIRLVVLTDLKRGMKDDKYFPLDPFVVVNTAKGTIVTKVIGDFFSEDRQAPVELRLAPETNVGRTRATVLLRSDKGCIGRSFAIDSADGTIVARSGTVPC